jgi:hypothetical protein|nr:MAG TPA: excisionase [Caudoviricetes sp.]
MKNEYEDKYGMKACMHSVIFSVEELGEDPIRLLGEYHLRARKWLNLRGCPVLPRGRGGRYRVLKDEFERWLKNSRAI